MTLIPPAVQRAQREAVALKKRTASAWPASLENYPAATMIKIIGELDHATGYLSMAIQAFLADSYATPSQGMSDRANAALQELHGFRTALEVPLAVAQGEDTVDAPHFRAAALAIMERTAAIWASLSDLHDASFSWMTDERAADITKHYEGVFEAAATLPGASRPLPSAARISMGLGIVGVLGTGIWMALRGGGNGGAYLPEAEEPPELPRGVHILGTEAPVIRGAKSPKEVFEAVRNLGLLRSQAAETGLSVAGDLPAAPTTSESSDPDE